MFLAYEAFLVGNSKQLLSANKTVSLWKIGVITVKWA